ncbi:MAG TPA: four helix bundle protein [Bacteroidales bacterium]|nr:four helix bundle protein [Bacteroidales bacterium]
MNYVKSYKELEVYQKTRELSRTIYALSKNFPIDERFSLTDQIRRSSRSVGAQIAESWGKRKYEKHFISKLSDADSEQFETQHWIETANECEYISDKVKTDLLSLCESIGRMLQSMMDKSSLFCSKPRVLITDH